MFQLVRNVRIQKSRLITCFAAMMAVSGCSISSPNALKPDDILTQSRIDREAAQRDVEPITGPLTLDEAIARALKYNLDQRVLRMEEVIASGTLDVSRYDMLPKAVARAGYRYRNNDLISRSEDSVTGAPSLANPYVSTDKEARTMDLDFTWSLLDFGLSYYNAKQNADRVLIAGEQRRKAVNILIRDVQSAFWRASSAQKLQRKVLRTINDGEAALHDARKVEKENLQPPLDSLRYQRQLLENLRLLEAINQDLSTAKLELATLINAPLTSDFAIKKISAQPRLKIISMPIEQLEDVAIVRNPGLREQFYNTRIARAEVKKVFLKIFPGISFNYGFKRSTDSFLINQSWQEAGAQISANLVALLSAPSQKKLADAGVALADQRRIAMQMAVIAQLHLAKIQYINAQHLYERADALWRVDERIAEQSANQEKAETGSQMQRVANETTAILSELRRYQALAQAQAAASHLQATLGMDPDYSDAYQVPLKDLIAEVAQSMKSWQQIPTVMPADPKIKKGQGE